MRKSIVGRTRRPRLWQALAALIGVLALLPGTAFAAEFGVSDFDGGMRADAGGEPYTQAGGHPYAFNNTIVFNTEMSGLGLPLPVEDVKDIEVELPTGTVGNPTAMPTCDAADFFTGASFFSANCPEESQIGIATVDFLGEVGTWSLYNLTVGDGKTPALLGFSVANVRVILEASLRSEGGDYGIDINVRDINQGLPISSTDIEVWGVPADSSHDKWRCQEPVLEIGGCMEEGHNRQRQMHSFPDLPRIPYMTQPTACTAPGEGLETRLTVNSWPNPEAKKHYSFKTHLPPGYPLDPSEWGPEQGPTGCENVPFEPTFKATPTTNQADSPSGLEVEIGIDQQGLEKPNEIAPSHLRDVVVTLPAGMAVNAPSADGLGSCTTEQIGLGSTEPAACPPESKIGTVRIDTPVLRNPLTGSVYLAKQGSNPFNSLLALYIVAEGSGVVIKLAGKVEPDPQTGQLRSTFSNNPQLPFSRFAVSLKGGPRAPLVTPKSCGIHTSNATLTPWSGGAAVNQGSSFEVVSGPGGTPCPGGQLAPKMSAGTTNPVGGTFSPFVLKVSREDGSGQFDGIQVTLPEGLLGKLAGIPYCPEAAIASIPAAEGTGAAQFNSPSCPAASQVANVVVSAGAGSLPLFVKTGRAYLAGPYKGAPLSLAIVTPAIAGPFDLGNVVVRTALHVDPKTARINAVSDPLPTILYGIPLNLRSVEVNIDRSQFTLNPTSCDPMTIDGTITGPGGQSAAVSNRFQVGDCARLGFKPRLTLQLKGGTKRTQYPALIATLRARPGDANIGRASVALPRSEFLAQEHIRTICTRVQWAADKCPKAAIYGRAEAVTPLLDKPLRGPVYLRSSNNPLPDLVADLRGQIRIELVGRIDSHKRGIRTTFATVPDAPVTRFTMRMQGGKKGLLVNSRDICRGKHRATVQFDGQNNKVGDQKPLLKPQCKGKRKGKSKSHKRAARR